MKAVVALLLRVKRHDFFDDMTQTMNRASAVSAAVFISVPCKVHILFKLNAMQTELVAKRNQSKKVGKLYN